MDAVEFLEEMDRMTNGCDIACEECPMSRLNNGCGTDCAQLTSGQKVHVVEEWSKAHPKKDETRGIRVGK